MTVFTKNYVAIGDLMERLAENMQSGNGIILHRALDAALTSVPLRSKVLGLWSTRDASLDQCRKSHIHISYHLSSYSHSGASGKKWGLSQSRVPGYVQPKTLNNALIEFVKAGHLGSQKVFVDTLVAYFDKEPKSLTGEEITQSFKYLKELIDDKEVHSSSRMSYGSL
jgi:hypothetical protein